MYKYLTKLKLLNKFYSTISKTNYITLECNMLFISVAVVLPVLLNVGFVYIIICDHVLSYE